MSNITKVIFKVINETAQAAAQGAANAVPEDGGGQRDFRFPAGDHQFVSDLLSAFPEQLQETNVQGLHYRQGRLSRIEDDVLKEEFVKLSPPTNTRNEYRISSVNAVDSLKDIPAPSQQPERVILLLVCRTDGSVWPYYVLENSLQKDWHPAFAESLTDDLKSGKDQGAVDIASMGDASLQKGVNSHLSRSRNVIISGAPGTGKSTMLSEAATSFERGFINHKPRARVPVPANMVLRTVFHQNSKYRDFVSGITPTISKVSEGSDFSIVRGALYRASEYARSVGGAALLLIDEINRGPAVQVFGGSIVAIESDKRLAADGSKHERTQFFEILHPDEGVIIEYALPHDLYILAAMNQADASVEPLDVAFLRRWEPLRLEPDEKVLRDFYGLGARSANALPDPLVNVTDALEASVRAWVVVNEQISLGRGPEFQIGHGVLMSDLKPQTQPLPEALGTLCVGWAKVRAHIEEVFFGDTRGIAATLNALDGPAFNPFKLTETTFAGDLRSRLEGPTNFNEDNIYPALRAFAKG